ncbi:MAG: Heimdall-CTERM domain-containing surface protein [Candidatus Hodarchaeota archaeon]
MKKKFFIGISVILLLTLLTMTFPANAADYAGHDFSEEYFAVEIDLYPDPTNPDVIYDLGTDTAGTDTHEDTDLQFFMSYINDAGHDVAFSALEKMEHWIKLRDLLPSEAVYVIEEFIGGDKAAALDENIFHINATAPFQQLVQHFNTFWGDDAFVTNNFMALVAYSANESDMLLDDGDELYLGYTFTVQALIDEINEVLALNGQTYEIPNYDYEASFEVTPDGYKFGIKYTNMFVVWQEIGMEIKGPDFFGKPELPLPKTEGIVYGRDIVAASVLDHLTFEYIFTTEETDDLEETDHKPTNLGTVETRYHIGETNLLITQDDQNFITDHMDNWTSITSPPFVDTPVYELDIPEALQNIDLNSYGLLTPDVDPFPAQIPIPLPQMAFFVGDDAKMRMKLKNDFGLSVVTSTNWYADKVIEHEPFTTKRWDTRNPIWLKRDGKSFFKTFFEGKDYYYLQGLDFEPYNINPNEKRDVYVDMFIITPKWGITGVARDYFIIELGLAHGFTKFVASKIASGILYPGEGKIAVERFLYLTLVEFPEWLGGEIVHDPAYSAVAAVAAAPGESDTDNGGGVPGFEFLTVLLAIPALYALYRKRR